MRTNQRRASILTIVVALLVAALVYTPGLSGDFLFDDFPNIVSNPMVHMEQMDRESLSRALRAYQPGAYGRPLATLWFGLDHLVGGRDPFVYKLSGLIVHLINTVLVFLLVRTLLAHPTVAWHKPVLAAGFIATIWAVHPLQVSSVLYVVQRMETLAATFTFLGLYVYLKARLDESGQRVHWGLVGLAFGLASLGMLSKETAVLFPAYVLMLELTLLRFHGSDVVSKPLIWVHSGILLVGGILFAWLILPVHLAESAYAYRDFTAFERVLSQPRALILYLSQITIPHPSLTTFYYDHFEPSRSLLNPWTTTTSLLFLLAAAGSAIALHKRNPLYSLGVGWFFAAHALTSNVINLELVFEHRNYIAILGVILALVAVLRVLTSSLLKGTSAILLASLVVLGFGGLATIRSATWGDPFNLAVDLITIAPNSSRAANDMATLYFGMSDANPNSPFFQFAVHEFERSRQLPRASIIPEQGLIVMSATSGVTVNDEWWKSLTSKVETRVHDPETLGTLHGLLGHRIEGVQVGDTQLLGAMEAYLERSSIPPTTQFRYSMFLAMAGFPTEVSIRHFDRELNLGRITAQDLEMIALAVAEEGFEEWANAILTIEQ